MDVKCIGGNVEHQAVMCPSDLQVCVAVCFLTCTPAMIMSGLFYFPVCIAQDDNHRTGRVGRGLSNGCLMLPFQCSDPEHHSKERFQGEQPSDLSLLVPPQCRVEGEGDTC